MAVFSAATFPSLCFAHSKHWSTASRAYYSR